MAKKLVGDVFTFACIIFAPLYFILNLVCSLFEGHKTLLKFGIVIALEIIILIIITIAAILKNKRFKIVKNKNNIFTFSCIIFSIVATVINLIAWVIKSEKSGQLWNIYTIITLLCFSIAISVLLLYFKNKSFLFKCIAYFIVTAVPYFIITVTISGFFTGTKIFIPIGAYVLVYGIIVTIFGIKKIKRTEKTLNEKPYESMFK